MNQSENDERKFASLRGILYTVLWYFSIWAGFLFICCPLWIFILVWPKIFLPVMATAFSVWEMYPVALMNLIFGTKIRITGDRINAKEMSVLIVNHRTRVDWNFLWGLMYYASEPRCHRMKISLKAPLRHMPSLGWVMQVANCLYLVRKWETDEKTMRRQLAYFDEIGHVFQMLLFPEGTDLTEHNLRRSNEFAKKNNLRTYSRVLHPKTTGFAFLVDTMRNQKSSLQAVYDLTLAYSDQLPQTEKDVLRGNFPKTINFHIIRYPIADLPTRQEDLHSWIKERWCEKENRLGEFEKNKNFPGPSYTSDMDTPLYLAFVVWTTLLFSMFYLFFATTFFFWWTIFHVCLFVGISYMTLGYQTICVSFREYFRGEKKRK